MRINTKLTIRSFIGLIVFLILAYGSSENKNNGTVKLGTNNNETTIPSIKSHSSNKVNKLNIKKKIASIEEQKQIVKSFVQKIDYIEKPATQSFKRFLVVFNNYQQNLITFSNVIQSATNAKSQCDEALFALYDLKVSNKLPDKIVRLLNEDKKNLKIAWSIKGTALNNIFEYFRYRNPSRIEYFINDLKDANSYELLGVAKIMNVYTILGIPKEWSYKNTSKNEEDSTQKEENKKYNSSNVSKVNPVTKTVEKKVDVLNDLNKKTKRQKRKEARKKRRMAKKKKHKMK